MPPWSAFLTIPAWPRRRWKSCAASASAKTKSASSPAGAEGETGATVQEGTGSHWEEGAAIGAAAGAGIGALWAVGMATIALPPLLPAVMVSSWLVSILASAASGAAIAGIAGALIGLGVPEDEAEYYEGEFQAGRTLVTVRAAGRYEEACEILTRFGAYDYRNRELARDKRERKVPVAREDVVREEQRTV